MVRVQASTRLEVKVRSPVSGLPILLWGFLIILIEYDGPTTLFYSLRLPYYAYRIGAFAGDRALGLGSALLACPSLTIHHEPEA